MQAPKETNPTDNHKKQSLRTAHQVVRVLGGATAIARKYGVTRQTVYNWKNGGRFPERLALSMRLALRKQGYDAPDALWAPAKSGAKDNG